MLIKSTIIFGLLRASLAVFVLGLLALPLWGADADKNPTTDTCTNGSQKIRGSAVGGRPIADWYDLGPSSGGKAKTSPKGKLYDKLMQEITETTTNKPLLSAVFFWMQGESDGYGLRSSSLYAKSLTGLIQTIRDDLKRPDVGVVIGPISDHKKATAAWDEVRKVQAEVAGTDPLARWFDTDDLNGEDNNIHYGKGATELGKHFAEKSIELLRLPSGATPTTKQPATQLK